MEIKLKLKGKLKVKMVWIRRFRLRKKIWEFEENGNKMTCINQLVILGELVNQGTRETMREHVRKTRVFITLVEFLGNSMVHE